MPPQPLDLVDLFKDKNSHFHASIDEVMFQVYSYMVLTGVEFGFLSCWFFTWLLRRPMDKCNILQVSRPFSADDQCMNGAISATAALAWLEHHAIQRTHTEGYRHACIPLARTLHHVSEDEQEEKVEEVTDGDNDFDPNTNEHK